MGVTSSGSPKGIGPQIAEFANPGPTFSPLALPNIRSWFRADLGVTIATGVSNWVDQSGKSTPLTQSTGATQPTRNNSDAAYGGQATLSFNGAQGMSNTSDGGLPNQHTLYLVGESDVSAIQQNFTIDGNCELIVVASGAQFGFYGGTGLYDPVLQPLATPQMICVVCNGANSAVYRNSTTPRIVGTTGANALGGQFGIGNSGGVNFLTGKIAEVVTYAGVHTPATVATMFAYFAQRYSLPFGSIVGPSFSPLGVAPCQLWLRGDRVVLNGTTVSQWNDLSGNGNNCSNGSQASQPTYNAGDQFYGGQPTLSYGGTQSLVNTTLAPAQPYTVICVGESQTATGGMFGSYGNGTPPISGIIYSDSSFNAQVYCGAAVDTAAPVNKPSVISGVFNGASTLVYVNSTAAGGQVSGNAGTTAFSGGYALGSGNGAPVALNGKLAEVLVYTGALSAAQMAQLYAYFSQRYNIHGVA